MMYLADSSRYGLMPYHRCGKSGLKLPAISLGLWQNFGGLHPLENSRSMLLRAFDLGITHFDLANNYGPPAGAAEENFGRIIKSDLKPYRDELIISSKAGFTMWEGPYGDGGSRKYLLASLDQSLRRMGLDYVDIFYHHRPHDETPLEETALALDQAVRQGKALYVGVSNYKKAELEKILPIFRELRTPFIINQPSYSMLNRWIEEDGLKEFAYSSGLGTIVYCPLAQGLLTDKYLKGIPADSRAGSGKSQSLSAGQITPEQLEKIRKLNEFAQDRGQTLAQMALSWILRDGKVTSALIGASKVSQIEDCVQSVQKAAFTEEELRKLDEILG